MVCRVPWKWERGTRCYCKTKKGAKKAQSDGNLLDSNAVLEYASRSDLQTTIRQLERTKASLVTAPDAEAAVRVPEDGALHERSPVCPDVKTARCHRESSEAGRCQERSSGQSHGSHGRCKGPLQRTGGQTKGSCCKRRGAGLPRRKTTATWKQIVWAIGGRQTSRAILGRNRSVSLKDFTGARAAIVGDRNVEIGDGRDRTDPASFQQSILAENAKFQQTKPRLEREETSGDCGVKYRYSHSQVVRRRGRPHL